MIGFNKLSADLRNQIREHTNEDKERPPQGQICSGSAPDGRVQIRGGLGAGRGAQRIVVQLTPSQSSTNVS